MTSAISDYALIGDGRSCALVARTGSIDFLCWPRFDSDACFAALLGDARHGHWRLAPAGFVTGVARRYREDTAILETEHTTETGRVRVTDLMPWGQDNSSIIRRVEGLAGEVEMEMTLRPRFGYGQIAPWTQPDPRGAVYEAGPDRLMLDAPVALEVGAEMTSARFKVAKGEMQAFALGYSLATRPCPAPLEVGPAIRATEAEWRRWSRGFDEKLRWAGEIRRSLITLRLLTDRESGAIIAAATLGLPEIPGGAANWDYRYCWLRDSTFTLTAFLNAGFHEEAKRWRDWILRAVAGQPAAMRIAYRVDGGRRLPEHEIDDLPGYQGARPVRIGNAASGQRQIDVYGELLDSFSVLAKAGIARTPRIVEIETGIVRLLEKVWDKPGSDIWESRGPGRRYTHSQAMAWVGVTRFLEAHAESAEVDRALIGRLRALGDVIHRRVCENGYSSELGHFTRYPGSRDLDAALLLLPLVDFLPVEDPRIARTIAAVERDLMEGGLVRRRARPPGAPAEGAFLACSCWLADCYKMQGREDEAAALLERVIGVANDLGLLSEEYDVQSRSLTGNMPQGLTHLGIINTALFLQRAVIKRGGG